MSMLDEAARLGVAFLIFLALCGVGIIVMAAFMLSSCRPCDFHPDDIPDSEFEAYTEQAAAKEAMVKQNHIHDLP